MSKTFQFAKEYLDAHPGATFEEVSKAAKKRRIPIIPIVYGRARAACGLKSKVRKKKAVNPWPHDVKGGMRMPHVEEVHIKSNGANPRQIQTAIGLMLQAEAAWAKAGLPMSVYCRKA